MIELPAAWQNITGQFQRWSFKGAMILAKKRVRILLFVSMVLLTGWLIDGRVRQLFGEEEEVLPVGIEDEAPQLAAEKLNGIIAEGINRTRLTVPAFDQYGSLWQAPKTPEKEANVFDGFEN